MTSIPLLYLEDRKRPGPVSGFLLIQCAVWSAYGAALMIPWLSEYSVAVMLPNKIVIAMTGIAISTGLRVVYLKWLERTARAVRVLAVAGAASVIGGLAWSILLTALLGRSPGLELRSLGLLADGVPRFGGVLYEIGVLMTWSLVFIGFKAAPAHAGAAEDDSFRAATSETNVDVTAEPQSPPAVVQRAGELLVVQDGSRALIGDPEEIDWVEAAGDYVRIHTNGRHVMLRGTMTAFEQSLGASYVRIHRSTIVHIGRVREVIARPNKEYLVVLRDGRKLRASRNYSDRLRAALRLSR